MPRLVTGSLGFAVGVCAIVLALGAARGGPDRPGGEAVPARSTLALMGLGVAGAMAGAFGGYQARTRLVKALGVPDYYVALAEDLVAIVGSLLVVSRV